MSYEISTCGMQPTNIGRCRMFDPPKVIFREFDGIDLKPTSDTYEPERAKVTVIKAHSR